MELVSSLVNMLEDREYISLKDEDLKTKCSECGAELGEHHIHELNEYGDCLKEEIERYKKMNKFRWV